MSKTIEVTKTASIEARLVEILDRETKGDKKIAPEQYDAPLLELGLTSMVLMGLLVAAEDEFNFEWATDLPTDTFKTIRTIATCIADRYSA